MATVKFDPEKLMNLDEETAMTMARLGEAVIGEDLMAKVPDFVEKVDEFMAYRKKDQRDDFKTALQVLESPVLRLLLGVVSKARPFSELSLEDRRKILQALKSNRRSTPRLLYAGLSNLTCNIFYGDPACWDDLDYPGVSVDDQSVLKGHPWRPDDDRPVCDQECESASVTC